MSVEAGAIANTPAGGPVRRVRLPNDRRTPAAARALVRSVLEEAGLDALLNEALLLTTELSTNAVVHANTELDIEVRADNHGLTVTVTDFCCSGGVVVTVLGRLMCTALVSTGMVRMKDTSNTSITSTNGVMLISLSTSSLS